MFQQSADLLMENLWHATWQAGLIVVIAFALVRATKRLPAALHCWIWRIALLKMLLVLVFAGTIDVPLLPSRGQTSATVFSIAESQHTSAAPSTFSAASDGNEEKTSAEFPEHSPMVSKASQSYMTLLPTSFWAVGVVIHLVLLAHCWLRARLLVSRATRLDDPATNDLLRQVAREAGLRRCPQMRETSDAGCPLVVGALRPVILLPTKVLRRLDAEKLRLLLRHEVAHIRRGDLWWNWLAAAAQAVFFFHPLVWLALREWRGAQESACDEYAVGEGEQSIADYAELLMEIAVVKASPRAFMVASGMFGAFPVMKRRIEKMQRFKQASRRTVRLAVGAIALGAVFGLLPWKLVPADASTPVSRAAASDIDKPATARSGKYTISVVNSVDISGGHRLAWDRPRDRDGDKVVTREFSNRNGRGGGRAEAGGRSGTFTAPNFALAINISPLPGDFVVKLDGAKATDSAGQRYQSVDHDEPFRMTVPSFEAAYPGCAGAYFRFDEKPAMFEQLNGTLLLVPVKIEEAVFASRQLRAGAQRKLDGRTVTLSALDQRADGIDLGVSITVAGPDRNARGRRAFREFTSKLRELQKATTVTLIDETGNVHLPRAGGGSSGGSGKRQATINLECQFAPLPDNIGLKAVHVSIIQPNGQPRRVPFQLRNVELH